MKLSPGLGKRRITYGDDSRDLIVDLGEVLKQGVASTHDDYGLLDSKVQFDCGTFGYLQLVAKRFSLTLSSGSSVTDTDFLPGGIIILGAQAEVTTTITGATTWDLGDETDDDCMLAAVALASGTTADIADSTALPYLLAAESNLVVTANGSDFTAGVVEGVVWYIELGGIDR